MTKIKILHRQCLFFQAQIKKSSLFPYVTGIWLFGSCARGEQTYDSDVDLFMELALSETDFYEKRNDVLFFKGNDNTCKSKRAGRR